MESFHCRLSDSFLSWTFRNMLWAHLIPWRYRYHIITFATPLSSGVIVYSLKAARQVWISVTPEVQAVSSKSKVACVSGFLSRYDRFKTSCAVFLFLHGNMRERHIHHRLAHPPHCHPLEHCFMIVAWLHKRHFRTCDISFQLELLMRFKFKIL